MRAVREFVVCATVVVASLSCVVHVLLFLCRDEFMRAHISLAAESTL